ncbi:hypothetical protein CKF46_36035, partial [Klebsiella pneumoniae]
RALRLRLRHNLIKNPLRVSGIAKASSRQRHPPLVAKRATSRSTSALSIEGAAPSPAAQSD